MTYTITVTMEVPDVQAEDLDEAINFVTEEIEGAFAQRVHFTGQHGTEL